MLNAAGLSVRLHFEYKVNDATCPRTIRNYDSKYRVVELVLVGTIVVQHILSKW
jgi:hypothetical protein